VKKKKKKHNHINNIHNRIEENKFKFGFVTLWDFISPLLDQV
jgi:hypothetical protein